jgi:hypothetical protein
MKWHEQERSMIAHATHCALCCKRQSEKKTFTEGKSPTLVMRERRRCIQRFQYFTQMLTGSQRGAADVTQDDPTPHHSRIKAIAWSMNSVECHFSTPEPIGWWMEGMDMKGVLELLVKVLLTTF